MVTKENCPRGTTQEVLSVLVADDDPVSLRILQKAFENWGHNVRLARNGTEAWQVLTSPEAPGLAVLDWMMPGMDGPTICRRARALPSSLPPYLILLTARDDYPDIVTGLEAGANDYITKPFHHGELRARVRVGFRVLELQRKLADRVLDLETALKQVKQLRGLLPICMYCKKIRSDGDYWQQLESYVSKHSDAEFSHGICPECYEKLMNSQRE
ncbi:MAG TPA: response regulator [Terriglobia bacterium]|nr:response regulator [Terriglobia bacterium]